MTTRTIIITGASRGLGAAAARIAAAMGASVALNARSADDLARVAGEIREAGGQALALAGDVSRAEDCRRVVAETVERFGGVDAVVNNAGVIEPIAAIADGDPQAWEKNWAVNVLGPVMLTRAALPHLRQRGGRVLNVSSGAAVNPIPGWAAYCSAKAAVNQFNAVLAREEPGITAIAFRPGVVDTAMQAAIRREGATGMPSDEHARFVKYHANGELLAPELPGRALAVLALHAPHEWSGAFISWDEERVRALKEHIDRASL